MGSIRANNGKLFWDFRLRGKRCREYSLLEDTPANRARMQKVLDKIEAAIKAGTFDYEAFFPNSRMIQQSVSPVGNLADGFGTSMNSGIAAALPAAGQTNAGIRADVPTFEAFSTTWVSEMSIGWRRTYLATVQQILDGHLIPRFGRQLVHQIRREDILAFRADLGQLPGRKEGSTLLSTVNNLDGICRVFDHAA